MIIFRALANVNFMLIRGSANKVTQKYVRKLSSTSDRFVSVIEDENARTATLILQRAPVNSLNLELLQQITAAIKELEQKKYRGFVLSSSSPTVFSAGLDIMEMYRPEEKRLRAFWKSLQEMWKTLYLTPLITIAAINGHAPAGGCMMALSCDYRIMVNGKGTIGMNETLLGISAPKWFQTLAINSIGFRQAEKALCLGMLFSPEQALSLGIVDELAANADELQTKISNQLALWLKIPDAARRMTKLSLRKQFVDALHSYEEKELEEVVKTVQMDIVQTMLAKYIETLKVKST